MLSYLTPGFLHCSLYSCMGPRKPRNPSEGSKILHAFETEPWQWRELRQSFLGRIRTQGRLWCLGQGILTKREVLCLCALSILFGWTQPEWWWSPRQGVSLASLLPLSKYWGWGFTWDQLTGAHYCHRRQARVSARPAFKGNTPSPTPYHFQVRLPLPTFPHPAQSKENPIPILSSGLAELV